MADLNNLLEELEADPLEDYEDEGFYKAAEAGRPSVETAATEPLSAEDWDSPGASRRFVAVPAALQEAKRSKETFLTEDAAATLSQDFEEEETGQVNVWYAQLHQFWHQEKHCPELLEYDVATVEEIKAQMVERQEWIEQVTEELADPNLDAGDMAVQNLFANIAQVDLDRVKYVLVSWMAERLAKIEAHPLHMREKVDHLSDAEVEYLKEYGSLLHDHLHQTVLDHVPEAWQSLDEDNMIDKPDYDSYHFWLVNEMIEVDEVEQDVGSTLVAKYTAMRDFMRENKVELLI